MSRKTCFGTENARQEYESVKDGPKPKAKELAKRHGIHESTITRQDWYIARPWGKNRAKENQQ